MAKQLFVTGTGTDIGKTYVSGLLLKRLREVHPSAAYYKAAMSGNERDLGGGLIPGDASFVKSVSGIGQELSEMCPYVYEAALSPHLASRIEGNPVCLDTVLSGFDRVCERYEYVLAEGSGGILCPLRIDTQEIYLEDFIKARHIPCVIVADAGLGTINSVVLTAEYMKSRGIEARGLIFNNYEPENVMHDDNIAMCERLTGIKAVACVKHGDDELDISYSDLEKLFIDRSEIL